MRLGELTVGSDLALVEAMRVEEGRCFLGKTTMVGNPRLPIRKQNNTAGFAGHHRRRRRQNLLHHLFKIKRTVERAQGMEQCLGIRALVLFRGFRVLARGDIDMRQDNMAGGRFAKG